MKAFFIGAAIVIEVLQLMVIYLLLIGRKSCCCECHSHCADDQAVDIEFVEVDG